jgi:hypothetical protein
MDKKQMYVQVVNLETGKIFSLPTLYTDRVEACVCGQNYLRDRQAEDRSSKLFFRVLNAEEGCLEETYSLWEDESENESDCDCPMGQEDCFGCPNFSGCWEEGEAEEPSGLIIAEILNVLNAT